MTANVELLGCLFGLIYIILWVLLAATSIALLFISIIGCGLLSGGLATGILTLSLENDGMHPVDWSSSLVLAWEEFLAAHGACNDVTDEWISLW